MMNKRGYASIFYIVVFILLATLAIGSFLYLSENIAKEIPDPTPTPEVVYVDKSQYKPGEILVTFKNGTTWDEAELLFNDYQVVALEVSGKVFGSGDVLENTNVFQVFVVMGLEEDLVSSFKADEKVQNATLNYLGASY